MVMVSKSEYEDDPRNLCDVTNLSIKDRGNLIMYEQLTIYCTTGATFAFFDVKDPIEDEGILSFYYISKSTGKSNRAEFTVSNIAGYSVATHDKKY